jgi:hypothetical protein
MVWRYAIPQGSSDKRVEPSYLFYLGEFSHNVRPKSHNFLLKCDSPNEAESTFIQNHPNFSVLYPSLGCWKLKTMTSMTLWPWHMSQKPNKSGLRLVDRAEVYGEQQPSAGLYDETNLGSSNTSRPWRNAEKEQNVCFCCANKMILSDYIM